MKKNKELSKYIIGYNNLKKKNSLDQISLIQEKLSKKCKFVKDNFINNYFFIENFFYNEVFVNIFLSKIGISKLRNVLIAYNSSSYEKVCYAMPEEWIKFFLDEGYKVNIFISKLKFINLILKHFMIGIYTIIKINFLILINFFNVDLLNFSYFNKCSVFNFPRDENSSKYNLFNFCKINFLKNDVVNFLYSSNSKRKEEFYYKKYKFNCSSYPFKIKLNLKEYFFFLYKLLIILFFTLFSLILGHWWNVIMLSEQPLKLLAEIKKIKNLPKDIIFNLSDLYYRPLWTYVLENRGSRVFMIWYSANNQANYKKKIKEKFFYDWVNINWPINVVWNQEQKIWLENYIGAKKTKIIYFGYVWLNDYKMTLEFPKNQKYLSVFTVNPYSLLKFSMSNEDELELLKCENAINFLKDIISISKKNQNFKILLKNKREILSTHHPKYMDFLKKNENNFEFINENVSPIKIMENSFASVNFPFTSTAYLSKNMNLPTCYYDVTGKVNNFSFDNKIDLIKSKQELQEWVSKYL